MKKIMLVFMSLVFSSIWLNADMVDTSTKTNLINDLSKIYSDFDSTDRKIYTTNKFNCNTTGCSTSNFNNIGILSLYEYNKVGGDDSYLYNMNTFFVLNGTNVEVLNGSGDNSYVRPSVHLVPDTKVTGSGTYDDPWKIYDMIYYNYNISVSGGSVNPSNGQVLEGNTLTITLTPDSSHTTNGATTTCSNGVINGNILTISNVQSDLDCQVVFPIKKYYISVSSSTGSVSPSSVVVNHGNSVTLSLTPSTGYTAVGATTTCTNATISGRSLIIRNVSQNMNCTVTFSKSVFAYNITASGGTITPRSGSIGSGQNLIIQLTPDLIHKIKGVTTTCSNSTITGNVLTISNVKSALNCSVTFPDIYLPGTLAHKLMNNNSDIRERETYMEGLNENTNGRMYKIGSTDEGQYTEDVDGDGMGEDSYYFAGNMTKNWVKFGGYYWRVIRINEDGSVRLLYSGTTPSTTSAYIGTVAYNTTKTSYMYGGYMYGTNTSLTTQRNNTTSSNVKKTIDTWYKNNLKTSYDKYISKTAIYCNERAVGDDSAVDSKGAIAYHSACRTRMDAVNGRPSYRCGNKKNGSLYETTQAVADKFSASTSGGGNGKLTYPIALMTVDEMVFAGAVFGDDGYDTLWTYNNSNNASITGTSNWWTMSPSWYNQGMSLNIVYGSKNPGKLISTNVTSTTTVVRPVISLKYCTQYSSGDGSSSNPYTVSASTSCSSAVN